MKSDRPLIGWLISNPNCWWWWWNVSFFYFLFLSLCLWCFILDSGWWVEKVPTFWLTAVVSRTEFIYDLVGLICLCLWHRAKLCDRFGTAKKGLNKFNHSFKSLTQTSDRKRYDPVKGASPLEICQWVLNLIKKKKIRKICFNFIKVQI